MHRPAIKPCNIEPKQLLKNPKQKTQEKVDSVKIEERDAPPCIKPCLRPLLFRFLLLSSSAQVQNRYRSVPLPPPMATSLPPSTTTPASGLAALFRPVSIEHYHFSTILILFSSAQATNI